MKLIILDHNGVISESSSTFVKTPDEWVPIPGSLEAISRLTHNGYLGSQEQNRSEARP